METIKIPKYISVYNQLKNDIMNGSYADNNRLEPENILMEKYQVSRQTIRQAVNILEDSGLVKRRQGSGTYVTYEAVTPPESCPKTIGLITPSISESYFYTIISDIEKLLSEKGYLLQVFSTRNQLDLEHRILVNYLNYPVDGLIIDSSSIISPNPNMTLVHQIISRQRTPVIFINGHPQSPDIAPHVYIDDYSLGKMAADYLYQKGHLNIAGVFGLDSDPVQKRYSGFSASMLANGLEQNVHNIIWFNSFQLDYSFDEKMFPNLPSILKRCTAFVCNEDASAIRIMKFLYSKGYRIPEDYSIISLFNSRILTSLGVTSFEQFSPLLSKIVTDKLIHMINGGTEDSYALSPDHIMERGSVAAPRQK